MDIEAVFRIAAVGLIVAVVHQLLCRMGREELAMLATLAGLVVVLMMVVDMIAQLLQSVRQAFALL